MLHCMLQKNFCWTKCFQFSYARRAVHSFTFERINPLWIRRRGLFFSCTLKVTTTKLGLWSLIHRLSRLSLIHVLPESCSKAEQRFFAANLSWLHSTTLNSGKEDWTAINFWQKRKRLSICISISGQLSFHLNWQDNVLFRTVERERDRVISSIQGASTKAWC